MTLPPGADALRDGGGEPGPDQIDHLLDGKAMREHKRLGAAFLRAVGEQFERTAADTRLLGGRVKFVGGRGSRCRPYWPNCGAVWRVPVLVLAAPAVLDRAGGLPHRIFHSRKTL
jgi:hypothetical protein